MAGENAVAVMQRLFEEVYGQGNTALVDDLVAMPYFAGHLKDLVSRIHATLSEVSCRIEETVTAADRAAMRVSLAGVHTGDMHHPLGDGPATGNQIAVTGICIGRVAQGKLVEFQQEWNLLGLLQQVGVLAMPTSSG
jgi:hypothetical protein